MTDELDEKDKEILHAIQEDPQEATYDSVADRTGVGTETVRERLSRMKDSDLLKGFYPHIDYRKAGYSIHTQLSCRAPPDERTELAQEALELSGTVRVNEMVEDRPNVLIEAVCTDMSHFVTLHDELRDLGFDVADYQMYRNTEVQPVDHMGTDQDATQDDTGT